MAEKVLDFQRLSGFGITRENVKKRTPGNSNPSFSANEKPCILNGYRVFSILFFGYFPLCFPLPASNQAFFASFSVEIKASIRAELSRFICSVTWP